MSTTPNDEPIYDFQDWDEWHFERARTFLGQLAAGREAIRDARQKIMELYLEDQA